MPRALLTDRERDVVAGEGEIPRTTRSTLLSRVESKIEIMHEDARLLRKHQPELADELHNAVCERAIDERLEAVENEVDDINARVDKLEESLNEDNKDSG